MNQEGSRKRTIVLLAGIGLLMAAMMVVFLWRVQRGIAPGTADTIVAPAAAPHAPQLDKTVVLAGLSNVWDVGFLPDNTLLFTERAGTLSKVADGKKAVLFTVPDIYTKGEGGLLGLAVDPDFAQNRFVYMCYDTAKDIRVSRWRVNAAGTGLEAQSNIVTGMPVNTTTFPGRHSGCRPRFGSDGYLWIGTGDVGIGTNAQDPKGLGGKILRVDRDGKPAPGNLPAPFDPRIYSYGHRNVQGLAMLPTAKNGVQGYSIEHGSDKDDEVNALVPGNMGWNPVPGYNEDVPMTDKAKYPDAIAAIWSSGDPTIAPSGATFLLGSKWQTYQGRLAMAVLKGEHLRLLELDDAGKLKGEETLLKDEYGRLRSAVLSPDGDLYLTTDNGGGKDQIIRITPR